MNTISVVTVTYNSSFILESYLQMLEDGRLPGDEVILVDSGSEDVEVTRAIASSHGAQLIERIDNIGYGSGTNVGAALASADWLAIVNPDVNVSFTALRRLTEEALTAEIGCLGPSIIDSAGAPVHTVRQSIRPPWRTRGRRPATSGTLTITESISGCCMVMRSADFRDLGGFDPYFFMFCEEIDLHKRIRERGGFVAATSAVTVETPGGASSSTTSKRWSSTERAVAHVRFVNKHFSAAEAAIDLFWRYLVILRGGEYRPRLSSLRHLSKGVFQKRTA